MKWTRSIGALLLLGVAGCQATPAMKITQEPWGEHDGMAVDLYTLDNGRGMVARITNYGGLDQKLVGVEGAERIRQIIA